MSENSKNIYSSKAIVVIALIIAAIGIGFGVSQYNDAQRLKTTDGAKQAADEETKVLKAKVSQLMKLPSEKPTVATIKDITKLKEQAFFNGAKNGDKVLIFTEARKAIIYRESENKIINSGPIAVTSDQQTTKGVSVLASLNGSSADVASKIASIKDITVTQEKASKNYSKTQVVDVSGSSADKAKEIADKLGGEVIASIPNGETAPAGAAIVVFVKR